MSSSGNQSTQSSILLCVISGLIEEKS